MARERRRTPPANKPTLVGNAQQGPQSIEVRSCVELPILKVHDPYQPPSQAVRCCRRRVGRAAARRRRRGLGSGWQRCRSAVPLLLLNLDEVSIVRRIEVEKRATGSEVLDENFPDCIRGAGGYPGHRNRADGSSDRRHALQCARNTHPTGCRNHRTHQARNDRLAPICGEWNAIDLRKAPQHLELNTAHRGHVENGTGRSPAAPDHNAKRSTNLEAAASRFSSVTSVTSGITDSVPIGSFFMVVSGPDFVAMFAILSLAVQPTPSIKSSNHHSLRQRRRYLGAPNPRRSARTFWYETSIQPRHPQAARPKCL